MIQLFTKAVLAFAVIASPCSLSAQETVVDGRQNFKLKLPKGFVSQPVLPGLPTEVIHSFAFVGSSDDESDVLLFIETMSKILPEGPPSKDGVPPGFQGYFFTERWQGFDVYAVAIREQFGDEEAITFNVQIPLKPEAIQIKLFGPLKSESELRETLREILEGLKGESNWQGASFEAAKILELAGVFVLCGIVFVVILLMNKRGDGADNQGHANAESDTPEIPTKAEVTPPEIETPANQGVTTAASSSVEKNAAVDEKVKLRRNVAAYSIVSVVVAGQTAANYAGGSSEYRFLPNWVGIVVVVMLVAQIATSLMKIKQLD